MPDGNVQDIYGDHNFVVGPWGTLNVIQKLPELDKEGHRNLGILRDRVKQFWIRGVLEKSVHNEAYISLGRQTATEAVDHPWASTLELPDQKSQLLPSAKKTSEIFYQCGRALLILGEPGSGKTITLLEMARDLIGKSEIDPTQPVPVVFNLSTFNLLDWSHRARSFMLARSSSMEAAALYGWLIGELKSKYFVSKKLAELWLQQNRLLLLLDGLDEVAAESRSLCVEAIHKFIEERGSSGIAVCCRIADYEALPLKLKLNAAICVQPLTLDQIDHYLQQSGQSLAALRQAVNEDAGLRELARSPLLLSIMSLAYQDVTGAQLTSPGSTTPEERRGYIFTQYVRKMFLRKPQASRTYAKDITTQWLAGLARQMKQRAQTVFLVEGLQPDWLLQLRSQWNYFIIARGLGGLLLVCFLIAAFLPFVDSKNVHDLIPFFAIAPPLGAFSGFIEGSLFLPLGIGSLPLWKAITKRLAIYGGLAVLSAGVTMALMDGKYSASRLLLEVCLSGVLAGTGYGTLFAIVFGIRASRQSIESDIQTVESLAWSWRHAAKGFLRGFVVGCLVLVPVTFAIGASISIWLDGIFRQSGSILKHLVPDWRLTLFFSSIGGAIAAVLGFLFGGLVRGMPATKTRANQGIRLSFRNAFRVAAVLGLGLGLVLCSAIILLNARTPDWGEKVQEILPWTSRWVLVPVLGLYSGIFFGLLAALWYGGFDLIQHYTLRLLLWRKRQAPLRLVRFLDYSVDLIFLQKVGGGYIFIHRLLLEHFAAMEGAKTSSPVCPRWGADSVTVGKQNTLN